MEVEDALSYLTGAWTLSRAIADHRTGLTGCFAGEGEIRTLDRHGRYREHGRLRLGTFDGSVRRALELISNDDGGIDVRFTDGRPFFELTLIEGSCTVVHLCGSDRYELRFEPNGCDVLLERWRMLGPHKDYEAHTTWRRQ